MYILVITILLNTSIQTLEVSPFSEWVCNVVTNSIKEKNISLQNNRLVIQSVSCKESKE